ncbi:MAG TPA: PAS domain S-box protein [Chromatiales bacterium]|nr:PAS domain S-box protein [Chromatiales bacterium]
MKTGITPTRNEVSLNDDEFIVSKTDIKGRITYANRTFMRIADYCEDELLGVQHNIVRHPDMPRGVFRLLWQTLQNGDEFFGYVKNLTANGDYYWVYANITLDLDEHGKLAGYYSVRRKPKASAVAAVIPLYQEMLAVERRAGAAEAPDASIQWLQEKLQSLNTTYEDFVLAL